MGLKEDLKQVQDSRTVGKNSSTVTVDPGPFGDITPLEEPEKKDSEKEPSTEEEREEEKKEPEVKPEEDEDEDEDEVSPEKIKALMEKYKTPEELAKATLFAKRKMHVATSETAKLKKQNDELEKGRYTPPPSPPAIKPDIPVEDAIADKYYAEIERLKEDEPERDRKVVKLMAKMNAEISVAKQEESKQKDTEVDRHIMNVEARAKELGLAEENLDDFWIYAGAAPKNVDQDTAIRWTLDRINKLKGDEEAISTTVKEKTLEKVRNDDKEKKRMASLGKGSIKPSARQVEEEPNLSLSDALRQMRQQRVHK